MLLLFQITETAGAPVNDVSWFDLSLALGLILDDGANRADNEIFDESEFLPARNADGN